MLLEQELRQTIREIPDFPQKGVLFKDITPVLLKPRLVERCVEELARQFRVRDITKVVGIESRGFLLGPMIAQQLGAGFVIVRKKGKLPEVAASISYELEYGSATVEIAKDAIFPGDEVLIHDDLLATGGTAAATAKLVQQIGAKLAGFGFLISLEGLGGRKALESFGVPIVQLVSYAR
ncbi:MAG: adenine phosphoribosyltransferase [Bacteroidia bacterium]|nr:adenine phosphoribosyltransferase [Bacteroidia bacterium]MCX7651806.1 adenine phosphoribosyltransferase [Bacteroidia bacterium]MDW8417092.1 adenine phosphoribosyltransferase [Bacteroidia bacterium]